MNATRSLTILWTPWSAALSISVVCIAAGLCWMAWYRSGYSRSQGWLELTRFAIVALIAFILNQPEWVEEYRPEERPSLVVLWDDSKSMETHDVANGPEPSSGSGLASRREAIASMIDPKAWSGLHERMNVTIQPFGTPEPGSRTDIYEPLAEAPEKFKNLLGVVLISDGDWNQGLPPVQAATKLRLKGVPVFAVPVGSATRLPDIDLQTSGRYLRRCRQSGSHSLYDLSTMPRGI